MSPRVPGTQSPPTQHPLEVGTRALRWFVLGFPGETETTALLAAGRALERGVKVNAHVELPRPLSPAVASKGISTHVHRVKDYDRVQLESRDSSAHNMTGHRIGWNLHGGGGL